MSKGERPVTALVRFSPALFHNGSVLKDKARGGIWYVLCTRYDLVTIEGVGSPVGINLKVGDLVNIACLAGR